MVGWPPWPWPGIDVASWHCGSKGGGCCCGIAVATDTIAEAGAGDGAAARFCSFTCGTATRGCCTAEPTRMFCSAERDRGVEPAPCPAAVAEFCCGLLNRLAGARWAFCACSGPIQGPCTWVASRASAVAPPRRRAGSSSWFHQLVGGGSMVLFTSRADDGMVVNCLPWLLCRCRDGSLAES